MQLLADHHWQAARLLLATMREIQEVSSNRALMLSLSSTPWAVTVEPAPPWELGRLLPPVLAEEAVLWRACPMKARLIFSIASMLILLR